MCGKPLLGTRSGYHHRGVGETAVGRCQLPTVRELKQYQHLQTSY